MKITERELDILRRLAVGGTKATIASDLGVSENTISSHARNLYAKLGVHTAAHAVMRGVELQLLEVRQADGTDTDGGIES
jgi:DNA-binding NarL/FixJ family response regulator